MTYRDQLEGQLGRRPLRLIMQAGFAGNSCKRRGQEAAGKVLQGGALRGVAFEGLAASPPQNAKSQGRRAAQGGTARTARPLQGAAASADGRPRSSCKPSQEPGAGTAACERAWSLACREQPLIRIGFPQKSSPFPGSSRLIGFPARSSGARDAGPRRQSPCPLPDSLPREEQPFSGSSHPDWLPREEQSLSREEQAA